MESAPLIKAHDHARAASEATPANSTVAINEHTRAAGEFANAAKNTTSVEALRTLKLLEDHHRRLSELLQMPLQQPAAQTGAEGRPQSPQEKNRIGSSADAAGTTEKSDAGGSASNEKNSAALPTLPRQQRYPAPLGASIASNLASARGIRAKYRSQPLTPSVSNTEAPGNVEVEPRRRGSGSKSKMQSMLDHAERPHAFSANATSKESSMEQRSSASSPTASVTFPQEGRSNANDEGFAKFYSTFASIINRIPGSLAFAGLPLVAEEQAEVPQQAPEAQAQRRTRLKPSPSTPLEPDLTKIYSQATLRALSGGCQSATDSFYVVPSSGHTLTYANILSFADKEKRRMEASVHGDVRRMAEDADEEDFVDARESQLPQSPNLRKRTARARLDKEVYTMVEELYVENKSLKDMLDKLSKRLHAFESMSQNSGMRLAESMRLYRPGSPVSSPYRDGVGDVQLRKRNQELEEQLVACMKHNDELQKDYNKARANLLRYREKWDQLKAGAKARRAGGAQGAGEGAEEGTKSPSLG